MKWPYLFAFASAGFGFYFFHPVVQRTQADLPPIIVERLSNAQAEGTSTVTHAYSSVNPFNSDSTLVLLEKSGGIIQIRDLKGKVIRDNLFKVGILPTGNPVWSKTDPNLIYFHSITAPEIRSYNVQTNLSQTLYTFPEYHAISFGLGEGDLSEDSDHLPIIGDQRQALIFTISTLKESPAVDLAPYGTPDSFDVTPNNNAVLITSTPGGIYYFDSQMTLLRKVGAFDGHSDRARDTDGTDALVIVNSADPTPLPNCPNGIIKIHLADGSQKCLASFDWQLALHVSCNNIGQDWCLVSTYLPTSTMVEPDFSNGLVRVNLDGSPPIFLTGTGSSNTSYTRTPRAAVSPDGTYALFDSDMGTHYVDAYLATLVR